MKPRNCETFSLTSSMKPTNDDRFIGSIEDWFDVSFIQEDRSSEGFSASASKRLALLRRF